MTLAVLAVLVALAGVCAGVRGVGLVARALRDADQPGASLALIRGIRGVVVAVATAALAAGTLLDQRWLLVFGAIFLAEELYETGVVALVLRADASMTGASAGPPRRCTLGPSRRRRPLPARRSGGWLMRLARGRSRGARCCG